MTVIVDDVSKHEFQHVMGIDEASMDYRVKSAINEILNSYGDIVSVEAKMKSLQKFGRNDDVGTSTETVWLIGGDEVYPTGNDIDIVTSTSSSDTGTVKVEGHTLSGSNLTFVVQELTLAGTSNVALATPLYRANRLYNTGANDFVGMVTVEDDGTSVHLSTDGNNNQSLKCATSLSSADYWIVTQVIVGVTRQQTRSVDFSLQVRDFGSVFRTRMALAANSSGGMVVVNLDPCLIIPKNSDVRMTAVSSGASTGVTAGIHGHLASVQA